MTRQNNDSPAIPQGRRKTAETVRKTEWGGKWTADDKQTYQLDLFSDIPEKDVRTPAKDAQRGNRIPQRTYTASQSMNKNRIGVSATIERIVEYLDDALLNVVANKGAPGPDRQTVEEVYKHWSDTKPELAKGLLDGTYQPGDIRRVWIPKPGGGERGLGIPDVIDRSVQEACRMALSPLYEPGFHPSSHGFRPERSCHTAIQEAQSHLAAGNGIVVDIDLKDFFNSVNHQRLLAKLAMRISDKRVLALIGRMLKARVVMLDGVVVNTDQGVPQGGPMSPLLSNVYLDELDRELQRRGHRFVRYADDCYIYVGSMWAGQRVMGSIRRFIERRMRLEVNEAKCAVALPEDRHFLGFRLRPIPQAKEVEVLLSKRTVERVRGRIRELTPRNFGNSLNRCIKEVNVYLKGWVGFFGICTSGEERTLKNLDAHIRRRLRAIQLKQWKTKRTIARNFIQRGVKKGHAMQTIYGNKRGIWALSRTIATSTSLSNAHWQERGLLSLHGLWNKTNHHVEIAPVQMCLDLV
jgi:RNA-directed DNA polymerase